MDTERLSSGILYTELTKERDLYISLTIPSLIVASYGGGVGLATQDECLRLLGCQSGQGQGQEAGRDRGRSGPGR